MYELLFWLLLLITFICNIIALYLIRSHRNEKKITSDKGFSLAEVMVAAGLVAGLALALMRITSTQTKAQKKMEQDLQITSIMNAAQQALLNEDSCKNTLGTSIVAENLSLSSIKNRNNGVLFAKSANYQGVIIQDILLKNVVIGANSFGEANIFLTLKKANTNSYGAVALSRNIPIKVQLDAGHKVIRCYSATENAVDTAKLESCRIIGGTYNVTTDKCDMASYPAAKSKNIGVSTEYLRDWSSSTELADLYVNITGDTMTGMLNVNAPINSTHNISSAQGIRAGSMVCVGTRCRDFTAKGCAAGQLVKEVKADGSLVCQGISCPNTKYFEGLDSAGTPICRALPTKTCPTDYYVSEIKTDGTVTCSPVNKPAVSCSSGQYIQSISATGTPTCVAVTSVQNVNCPTGQAVGAITNGVSTCRSAGGVANATCPSGQAVIGISGGNIVCKTPALQSTTVTCTICGNSCQPPACPAGYVSSSTGACSSIGICSQSVSKTSCPRVCIKIDL